MTATMAIQPSPEASAAREESRRDRVRTEQVLEPRSREVRARSEAIMRRNHFVDMARAVLGDPGP